MITLLRSALLTAAVLVLAAPTSDARPTVSEATLSTAVSEEMIDTLAAYINQAMAELRVPGAAPPYLIRYKLTEVEVNDVAASLGATTSRKDRHFVNLEANVHVGDYAFDNTNFVVPQAQGLDGSAAIPLPLEPNPRLARRAAWLATDVAYKEALTLYNVRQQSRAGAGPPKVPSYTRAAKVIVKDDPVLVPKLETSTELETRAHKLSALFRGQQHVRDSRVAFTSFLERRWYLTSEGTSVHDTRRVSGVIIVVHGQASDGKELSLAYSKYGLTAADLPGDDELTRQAKALAKTLQELADAPLAESYTGPVLFEGEAAADLIRYTLAPHLGGTPVPEGLEKNQARQYGGAFADRIKRGLVLSPMLGVIDDPTAEKVGKQAVIGGYHFDDEGTPAEKVEVIKQGQLLTLLMGRTPSAELTASNGHARRNAPAGGYHGSATNLRLEARRGLTQKALIKKLLAQVKSEGLPYGMLIRQLDDAAITAEPERTRRELLAMINDTDVEAPPPVALAYRIYPDGRQELVRGVELNPVDVRVWKDVLGTSNRQTVKNFLASDSPNLLFKLRGVERGFVPSAGVESSVATPDLLFKELGMTASRSGRRAFPAVPPPK
ncbi:MAG TPA: metallopeptidase TldD-related protein [Kofleriaceae bacterium]|nr:metallopeptidase TldD-related protein [Kofleriaceae bacterium]